MYAMLRVYEDVQRVCRSPTRGRMDDGHVRCRSAPNGCRMPLLLRALRRVREGDAVVEHGNAPASLKVGKAEVRPRQARKEGFAFHRREARYQLTVGRTDALAH